VNHGKIEGRTTTPSPVGCQTSENKVLIIRIAHGSEKYSAVDRDCSLQTSFVIKEKRQQASLRKRERWSQEYCDLLEGQLKTTYSGRKWPLEGP
jgi:hypothetical protein